MFKSVCIFACMVCASALSSLDGKICAVQKPSIVIITQLLENMTPFFLLFVSFFVCVLCVCGCLQHVSDNYYFSDYTHCRYRTCSTSGYMLPSMCELSCLRWCTLHVTHPVSMWNL